MSNINKAVFDKQQLVKSKRFKRYSDILEAVLQDGKKYTVAEAEKAVDKFMKGKVQ